MAVVISAFSPAGMAMPISRTSWITFMVGIYAVNTFPARTFSIRTGTNFRVFSQSFFQLYQEKTPKPMARKRNRIMNKGNLFFCFFLFFSVHYDPPFSDQKKISDFRSVCADLVLLFSCWAMAFFFSCKRSRKSEISLSRRVG